MGGPRNIDKQEAIGVWVWGLGFRVWGLGFRVWGLGFRVWGLYHTKPRPLMSTRQVKAVDFVHRANERPPITNCTRRVGTRMRRSLYTRSHPSIVRYNEHLTSVLSHTHKSAYDERSILYLTSDLIEARDSPQKKKKKTHVQ